MTDREFIADLRRRQMTDTAKQVVEKIRLFVDSELEQQLNRADYRDVLEEFRADIEGRLDALNEERPDLFD